MAGGGERDQSGSGRRVHRVVVVVVLAAGALGAVSAELGDDAVPLRKPALAIAQGEGQPRPGGARPRTPPAMPGAAAMRRAWRFARRRGGLVSIAVVDTKGRTRTRQGGRLYVSASVVKAMLLVAELRRLRQQGLPLDPLTEDLLEAMITWSDNDAADAIYARVGDAGLLDVARSARMRRFTVAGYWGNAQVTAADMAHLFSRVRKLLPRPYRRTGLRMLASVVPGQRWGLPRAAAANGSWVVHFKGGWRTTASGELVHQAGLLRDRKRALAIAVLTDGQPSQLHAIHTVRGIADRLLRVTQRRRRP